MYSRQKHAELVKELDAAWQDYFPFISTGPLDPEKPIRSFDDLLRVSTRMNKAENALNEYLQKFIDKSGHIDFALDEKNQ
ncbi:MAG: hypothetical protein GYA46_12790 [candidate division Zixibacteria bacterium]|nr:hypothetical protein [candidate division Zixibacteria bacterium]